MIEAMYICSGDQIVNLSGERIIVSAVRLRQDKLMTIVWDRGYMVLPVDYEVYIL